MIKCKFLLLIAIFILVACSKKDNDIIQNSTTSLIGIWTLTNSIDSTKTIFNSGLYKKTILTINDTTTTEKDIYQRTNLVDSVILWTGIMNDKYYEFNKNGNFIIIVDYSLTYNWPSRTDENTNIKHDSIISRNCRWVKTGTWCFLAGINGINNKERVALVFQKIEFRNLTDTIQIITDLNHSKVDTYHYPSYICKVNEYANGENSEIWNLNELKYNQIIINMDIDKVTTEAQTGYSGNKTSIKGSVTQTLSRIIN